jgi:hypothetical protein
MLQKFLLFGDIFRDKMDDKTIVMVVYWDVWYIYIQPPLIVKEQYLQ